MQAIRESQRCALRQPAKNADPRTAKKTAGFPKGETLSCQPVFPATQLHHFEGLTARPVRSFDLA
jgi:hypothetical protein